MNSYDILISLFEMNNDCICNTYNDLIVSILYKSLFQIISNYTCNIYNLLGVNIAH